MTAQAKEKPNNAMEETKQEVAENLSDIATQGQPALIKAGEFVDSVKTKVIKLEHELNDEALDKLLKTAENVEQSITEWRSLANAVHLACEPLPPDIENKGRNLKTTYEYKTKEDGPEDLASFENKILSNQEINKTLVVTTKALSDNKFPYMVIGSTPFVTLAGNLTDKKPDDVDIAAGIQDFPIAYKNFKDLTEGENPTISNLKVIAVTGLDGKKNGSFEIKGYVVGGKEFSVFFSNIDPEKLDNGLLSVGYKDNKIDIYTMPDPDNPGKTIEVPLATRESVELLYAMNTLLEMATVDYENHKDNKEKYAWITPKMLQRMSNLMTLNNGDFNAVLKKLEEVKNNILYEIQKGKLDISFAEHFGRSYSMILDLKEYFENNKKYSKGQSQPGLADSICKEQNFPENVCSEKAIDKLTKDLKTDMKSIYNAIEKANTEMAKEAATDEEKLAKRVNIENFKKEIEGIYIKYDNMLQLINIDSKNDGTSALGILAMEREFSFPAAMQLLDMLDEIEEKK